jgi:hypothetical protein
VDSPGMVNGRLPKAGGRKARRAQLRTYRPLHRAGAAGVSRVARPLRSDHRGARHDFFNDENRSNFRKPR